MSSFSTRKIKTERRFADFYAPYQAKKAPNPIADVKYEKPELTSEPMDTSAAFVFDLSHVVPMEICKIEPKLVPFDKAVLPKDILEFDKFVLDRELVNEHRQLRSEYMSTTRAALWVSCHGLNKKSTCFCDKEIISNTFERAHIIPKSKGGPDTLDNLWATCKDCNDDMGEEHMYKWAQSKGYDVSRIPRSPDLLAWSRYVASKGANNTAFSSLFTGIEAHYFMKMRVVHLMTGDTYPVIFDKITAIMNKNIGLHAAVDTFYTISTKDKTLTEQANALLQKDKNHGNVNNVRRGPTNYRSTLQQS